MNIYTFPRKLKLVKTDEFSSVFNFRKRIASKHIAIHYRFNSVTHPRLGVVVGRKVDKLSVNRNYMRRVIRELFRLHQSELGGLDLVVRVQKVFRACEYVEIEQEFIELVSKFSKLKAPQLI